MHLTVVSLIVTAILAIAYASGGEWSYKDTATVARKDIYGPKDWGKAFKKCKGKSQSPINIVTKKAKKTKFGRLKLKFKDGNFLGSLVNNGHAPTFTLDKKQKGKISIKFDKKTYLLDQFHFHFGCRDEQGSEHTVDGNATAAEMHLVFHNKKYKKFKKASKKKDGLLVIGVLIEKSENPSYYWQNFDGLDGLLLPAITALSSGYVAIGNPVIKIKLPLEKLVPSLSYKKKQDAPAYYTYKGSLTTPGCYESVRWVVLKEPIKVSAYMLSLYRNLRTRVGGNYYEPKYPYYPYFLCDNYRPTQKLNDRKVEVFEPKKKKKSKSDKKKSKSDKKKTKKSEFDKTEKKSKSKH